GCWGVVLGSEKDLVATARVQNAGDDAFEAKLVVQVPRGAAFTKFLLLANTAVDESTYDHLTLGSDHSVDGDTSFLLPHDIPEEEEEGEVEKEEHHRRRRHEQRHLQELRGTHRRRRKRSEWAGLEEELSCGPTNCTRVVCSVSPLRATEHIVVHVRSRLWVDTIQKVGMPEVKISSRLVVVAGEGTDGGGWRLGGLTGEVGDVWSGMVTTVVRTGPEEHRRSLKWVVVVGSVLAGLLLLALLSTLLWAMGFFKRKRPQDNTETEPLNGNGFYGNGKT
ncbi:integrin alpha-V-like, partial [Homarus americanus]|uniref:integrin alpha-V-like n=1 Tax=Homarus americanus TaxID=6706 RepID=UPI001C48D97E